MSDSISQFLEILIRSGMISGTNVSQLQRSDDGTVRDDEAILEDVSDVLTDFQKSEVRNGKAQNLILNDHLLILEPLGEGGMGQVFLARHTLMKRNVAVKFRLPDANSKNNAAMKKRFLREVQTASSLSHANIVSALDAGFRGDLCFLVMEYVRGENLRTMVRTQGPMSFGKALDIAAQTAEGLEFAHQNGIVHRDVKPSNLLLRTDGVVKILDMGLARSELGPDPTDPNATSVDKLTRRGQLLGTVDFMAPEQALSPHDADGRADIYSLGCTLYFLLTGRPPFRTEVKQPVMDRVIAHREDPIPDIRELRSDVPDWFTPIFEKMMAKAPEDRFQNVAALRVELQRAQQVLEESEQTLEKTLELPKPKRTNRSLLGVGAVLLLLAVPSVWYGMKTGIVPSIVGGMTPIPEVIENDERSYNLLEHLRLSRDVLSPVQLERWSLTEQGLVLPAGDATTKLKYKVTTTADFHLQLDVSRRKGSGPLAVGLVARKRQFVFLVDRNGTVLLLTANDKVATHVRYAIEITTTEKTRIDVYVKDRTVSLHGNGKPLLSWPDIEALDEVPRQGWSFGDPDAFLLGSNDTTGFEITHLTLRPLEDSASGESASKKESKSNDEKELQQ